MIIAGRFCPSDNNLVSSSQTITQYPKLCGLPQLGHRRCGRHLRHQIRIPAGAFLPSTLFSSSQITPPICVWGCRQEFSGRVGVVRLRLIGLWAGEDIYRPQSSSSPHDHLHIPPISIFPSSEELDHVFLQQIGSVTVFLLRSGETSRR